MIIGIDFDGTLSDHTYPEIGDEVPFAFDVLKELQKAGHRLILLTMRSDSPQSGPKLSEAVEWCWKRGVEFWAVNENPEQHKWTASPKIYCNLYIDDAALGCPLVENPRKETDSSARDYVDWLKVSKLLKRMDYLPKLIK